MTGAWACAECAHRAGLGRGHAASAGGWCGVGGHASRGEIRWHPEAAPVARREEPERDAAVPASEPVQGSLF